ncbi:MAG: GNAT family N-acetyltransferase [Candidatus Heimdallarchaeota archaeon]|nr:GNAT family N-acetyltransferase [Candidatus Heimdallarchaeota archaeon]MDH5646232.1 GNAT family N-acetyltransferase [Candidatus Heimdallarchaeota archaeon]
MFKEYSTENYPEVINLWLKAGLSLSMSDTKEELEKVVLQKENKFIILEENEKIIGTIIAAFDGRRGYIHHLAVDPVHQNKGIGSLIMEHAINYFKENNVVKVHLFIDLKNSKVEKFYDKQGWIRRDDIILMTKTLRDEEFKILDYPETKGYLREYKNW